MSSHKTWSLVKAVRALRNFEPQGAPLPAAVTREVLVEYDRLEQSERELRPAALNVACRWVSNPALHDVVADLDLQMAIELNALVTALQLPEIPHE